MKTYQLGYLSFCVLLLLTQPLFAQTIVIEGKIKNHIATDTITLDYWEHPLTTAKMYTLPHHIIPQISTDGSFYFVLQNVTKPVYFSLGKDRDTKSRKSFLTFYFAEPGDSIFIDAGEIKPVTIITAGSNRLAIREVISDSIRFSGKGAAKYECQYEVRKVEKKQLEKRKQLMRTANFVTVDDYIHRGSYLPDMEKESERLDLQTIEKLAILAEYKPRISAGMYDLLSADIISGAEMDKLSSIFYNRSLIRTLVNPAKDSLLSILQNWYIKRSLVPLDKLTSLSNTKNGLTYLMMDAILKSNTEPVVTYLKAHYPATVSDKLITVYVLEHARDLKEFDMVMREALGSVQSDYHKALLQQLFDTQKEGSTAFNFQLINSKGSQVKLSDFKGKWVMLDFWYTGCGGCIGFYKNSFAVVEKYFANDPGIVFISVSIDTDRNTWIKSIREEKYTHEAANVVNLYTNGAGMDHPVIKYYNITTYPRPILIDPKGNIFRSAQLQVVAPELIKTIEKGMGR